MRPYVYAVPFGESTLIAGGCHHLPLGEVDLINEWIDRVATAPNGFSILMGDTFDFARTHYREHIRSYRGDRNSQALSIDRWVMQDIEKAAKLFKPIRKKLIGAIVGNHTHEFADGTNSEQALCRLLEIPYLGTTALVRLEFRDKSNRVRDSMVLWGHHNGGSRGGGTTASDVAVLERAEQKFNADIFLLSHTHQRHAFKKVSLSMTSKGVPHLVARTKAFARTGAFLKGYVEDCPTTTEPHVPPYAEESALRPTDLGWVEITIKLTESGGNAGHPKEIRQAVSVRF